MEVRIWLQYKFFSLLLLQSALQPLVGFRPAQLALSIRSRKVLLSAVSSGTSNLQLGGEQGFRAFQLSPQEAPSVWSDVSEASSRRWNYGREMAERILPKVATSTSILGSFTCRKARHGTDGFTSPPKEGVLRTFSPEKSDDFGQVWTRELVYRRPARYL
jgi:hypothetical protein